MPPIISDIDSTVHYPNLPAGFPPEAVPYATVLIGLLIDGDVDARLRGISSPVLRYMASEIVVLDLQATGLMRSWGLSVSEDRFWFHHILPRIKAELDRRDRHLTDWAVSQTKPPQPTAHRSRGSGRATTPAGSYKRKGHVYIPRVEVP